MFDCIIIGAGPAGTTAAYHLAKKKRSVLVLDKACFPRHKPCSGGVSPVIASWFDFDFTPVVDNTIRKVQYTWKMEEPMEVELKLKQPMWMVKRDSFDHFLVQQAQKQGAEFKDNTEVSGIKFSSDRYEINTSQGTFTASYLIAADGVNGPMTAWLGLKPRQKYIAANLEVKTEISPNSRNSACFDFGSLKNGYIWNFPKSDGYSISAAYFRGGKANPEELKTQLMNYAAKFGIDLNKSQYYDYSLNLWTENQPLHARQAVLAGEAAGILDPLIGEGIRPAMFTGLKASEAIDLALAGKSDALEQYTKSIKEEWGSEMVMAQRLAGLFHQFPQICYKVGIKRPSAGQIMGKILCGELRYSDVTEQAIKRLTRSLIPGKGKN